MIKPCICGEKSSTWSSRDGYLIGCECCKLHTHKFSKIDDAIKEWNFMVDAM